MEIKATREEKLELLKQWESRSKELDKQIESLRCVLRTDPGSPLLEAVYRIQDAEMALVSTVVGDTYEWLHWYRFETCYGLVMNVSNVDGKKLVVKNAERLLMAIELS